MSFGFNLYLLFIVSWFTHLSARLPILGYIRFDLILIVMLIASITLGHKDKYFLKEMKCSKINNIIAVLLIYIVVTIPFVQWPGSVLHHGFENYIKAIVFYYFTINLVTDIQKLKIFINVFLGCQSFRIIEPVFLHITQGYWGSFASMSNWEYMNRLSGAPFDVVNPNGLAFIILTVIPFFFYLVNSSTALKISAIVMIPLSIYALILTGSRSGMVGLLVILVAVLLKSKKKILVLSLICLGGLVCLLYMGSDSKDRFTSIFASGTKNEGSDDRLTSAKEAFSIALRKPFFGHGLGTSREANANFGTYGDKPTHDLYGEIVIELGYIGLAIFLILIKRIIVQYIENKNKLSTILNIDKFMFGMTESIQVWLIMNIIFSFASYGLSSYEWYLFAGLSFVTTKIINNQLNLTSKIETNNIMPIKLQKSHV